MPLRIVWSYPSPGIFDRRTGTGKLRDEYTYVATIGNDLAPYWTLGGPETLVPGVWVVEVWEGNRMLATQAFTLVH